MIPDSETILRTRELIKLDGFEGKDCITLSFQSLGAELSIRAHVERQFRKTKKRESQTTTIEMISPAFVYASQRLLELFQRMGQIEFQRKSFSLLEGEEANFWHIYAGLSIKDFHVDVASLMDSLAPVLIQVKGQLKRKDKKKLPGWADIQSGAKRSFRDSIPDDLIENIDTTERWWPGVKNIRHILTHRDHMKLIFGSPKEGILFQIYEGKYDPKILHSAFLWPSGSNVVDFSLYSSFILAEIMCLLEQFGTSISAHLNISQEEIPGSTFFGNFRSLAESLDRLHVLIAS